MDLLIHILRYKLRSFVKSNLDANTAVVVRGIGSAIVFGLFAYGAYALSHFLTRFVLEQTRAGLFLYHQFLSMFLFVFFVAVNMGNVIVSYSTLYRSPEVSYLLTKPVPFLTIFTLKFLDNFLYSSGTLFMMGFMVLLGYGTYFGYPWYFFLGGMVGVLVPFMFLSACIAVLVLMAIMKAAGRFGFRQVMAGLILGYIALVAVFFHFSNPVDLVEQMNAAGRMFAGAPVPPMPAFLSYLPNQWVSNFLLHLARHETSLALLNVGALIGATVCVFTLVLTIANRFYYQSWLVSLQVQSHALAPYSVHRLHLIDLRRGGFLPAQAEVLLKKEYFAFLREPSQWIHLLVMFVLTALFMISVGSLNLRLRVVDVQLLTYLVFFAFAGFMTSSVGLRFVFPMIGLEGKPFWLLRTAPVDIRKVYLFKFVVGFLLVLFLAECVAVASNIPFVRWSARRPLLLWFGMYEGVWMSLAVVSLNLGLGAFFANYLEKNPIRAASSQGATLTFLFTMLYLFLQVAIVILPLADYFTSLFHFTPFDQSSIVVPGTLLAMLSMIVAVASTHVGLRSLARDF
jgi:ABC-2 type transport system permease protein